MESSDPKGIYLQTAGRARGEWNAGERIPYVREKDVQPGANPDTVARSYPEFDHGYMERPLTEPEIPRAQKPASLPLGEQMKFHLALGLACRPAILILHGGTFLCDRSLSGGSPNLRLPKGSS